MSQTYVPAEPRRLVINRADHSREYCMIQEDDTYFDCEIDHVISEKHGGLTVAENLAYACLIRNRNKGSDLGSILEPGGALMRLFNPRLDKWSEHFRLEGVIIKPLTLFGQVTERIFKLNAIKRLMEREALRVVGRYPGEVASKDR